MKSKINFKEMKKILLSVLLLTFMISESANALTLTQQVGWLETAYVTWQPVANAESYNVYYSGEGVSNKKIDDQLIREYKNCYRADVLGLKAGSYTITIKAVNGAGVEFESETSSAIAVKVHDRSGFAFSSLSTFKTSSGAYNEDGTLKSGAKVIYVTAATAKTVKLDVVSSSKGSVTSCVGIGQILSTRQKGYDKTPLAIRFVGYVNASNMSGQIDSKGLLNVKGANSYTEMNTTVEGVGEDATAYGWGILVRQCGNVEVRNMGFMMFPEDGVSLDTDNVNVWVHNCDFFYGKNGGGDKEKGDGSLDSKTSGYVTISYNHFWDSGKCNLLGNGTEDPERLTYHHNWYDHSDSRHPRVRFHTVHVYNNYYDGNAKYGMGATMGSSIFSENNYFRNCKRPMLISMQGSDIAGGTGTFSSENGGMIKAYGNYLDEGSLKSFIPYSSSVSVEFDAYVVTNKSEQVPANVTAKKGGAKYNNFDTDSSIMYAYAANSPEEAKTNIMQYAGRVQGGDLKITFNNASDDSNYAVSASITSAITGYKTSLVKIQGESSTGGGGGEEPITIIDSPFLNEETNVSETGFNVNWTPVDGASQYIVKISHEEESSTNTPLFRETFNNVTTTVTGSILASGKTDNPASKFSPNGSSSFMCSEDGTMDLSGGRFTINNLDFSTSPKLYIKCKYISGTGKFIVTYASGTSSSGAVYNSAASAIGSAYTTLEIPLSGAAALIQLRTESNTIVRIDEILISTEGAGSKTITNTYPVTAPTTSYSFGNLIMGVEYTIEVIAKNANGEMSSTSNAIYVTPKTPSGIDTTSLDESEIKSVEYYTITGIRIQKPQGGIIIKKVVYKNGMIKTGKVLH